MMDPQERDKHLNKKSPEDYNPANINVFQARKCAQILSAYQDGHEGWRGAVDNIYRFLDAAASEGAGISMSPSSAQVWDRLDELPFAPIGPPKPQPDVDQ